MANDAPAATCASKEEALRECMRTLQQVANYRLPPLTDRRLLWLSENKERLSETEREEMLALVELAEDRTREKLQAQLVLQRLSTHWPELAPSSS